MQNKCALAHLFFYVLKGKGIMAYLNTYSIKDLARLISLTLMNLEAHNEWEACENASKFILEVSD